MVANLAGNGINQLLRIVANAVFEDNLDLLDVADIARRIAMNHNQISLLTWPD